LSQCVYQLKSKTWRKRNIFSYAVTVKTRRKFAKPKKISCIRRKNGNVTLAV